MNGIAARCIVLFLLVGAVGTLVSGESRRDVKVGARVTYISGSTAYLNAGREKGFAPGDSARVVLGKNQGAFLVITAVSGSSASARSAGEVLPVEIGDSVVVEKSLVFEEQRVGQGAVPREASVAVRPAGVTGSAALQFAGASLSDAGWTFVQPALLLRLNVRDLFGGFDLSLHGRSSYDLGPDTERFPRGRRLGYRVYTMSLISDDPSSWYGLGFGRLVSRYVGGLGAFDGGQVLVRQGRFAAGILAGFQPNYVTSGLNGDNQKFAGFVSYRAGSGFVVPAEVTLAYGQQMFRGKLDRDFLYVQSSFNIGSRFFLAQSSELDLHQSVNGERKSAIRLTNTYISLSSQLLDWCGASLGYDATRPVFLLETMKAIPDTLFDRDLYQGFRGGLSIRLPGNVFLTGQGSVRSKPDGSRTARSAGGTVRMMDIGGSGINLGARYARNTGVYTEGNDIGIDIDRWFPWGLSVAMRGSRYAYSQRGFEGQTVATTVSASMTWVAYHGWYVMGSLDRTWDPLRGSSRVLAEVGLHF
jgi:hypothetical protein